MPRLSWRGRRPVRVTRDSVLFAAGILGIGYETLVSQTDRPTLLVLFGAMCGLPAFLAQDERREHEEPPPAPADPDPVATDRKVGDP